MRRSAIFSKLLELRGYAAGGGTRSRGQDPGRRCDALRRRRSGRRAARAGWSKSRAAQVDSGAVWRELQSEQRAPCLQLSGLGFISARCATPRSSSAARTIGPAGAGAADEGGAHAASHACPERESGAPGQHSRGSQLSTRPELARYPAVSRGGRSALRSVVDQRGASAE